MIVDLVARANKAAFPNSKENYITIAITPVGTRFQVAFEAWYMEEDDDSEDDPDYEGVYLDVVEENSLELALSALDMQLKEVEEESGPEEIVHNGKRYRLVG